MISSFVSFLVGRRPPPTLEVTASIQGVIVKLRHEGRDIAPEMWFQGDLAWDADTRNKAIQWRRSEEIGVESRASHLFWPVEQLSGLSNSELEALLRRPRFPYLPNLYATSLLTDPHFNYRLALVDAKGREADVAFAGALALEGHEFWVLPSPLRHLMQLLRQGRPAAQQMPERYAELFRIKCLIDEAGGSYDSYLAMQEVYGLDKVEFDLEDDGDELTLVPRSPELPDTLDLVKMFTRASRDEEQYKHLGTNGKVLRIFPSENARQALNEWKPLRKLNGRRRRDFLNRPRAFMTSKAINWDDLERQASLLIQNGQDDSIKEETPRLRTFAFPDTEATIEWVEASKLDEASVIRSRPVLPSPSAAAVPPGIRTEFKLLQHQLQGLAWLQSRVGSTQSGALLADDMGLGKTLQILCFLEWMRITLGGTSIVIAPLILLQNWRREATRFFDGELAIKESDIVVLHGDELRQNVTHGTLDLAALTQKSLVITSFEMLKKYLMDLERVEWTAVVVDEAQNIKDSRSLIYQAVSSLRARFRLAATGTPVENHLGDLWSLLQFTNPGSLGGKREFLLSHRCDTIEEMAAISEKLLRKIEPYCLRRTKDELLPELPKKVQHFVQLEMGPLQSREYQMTFQELKQGAKRGLEATHRLRALSCVTKKDAVSDVVEHSCKLKWLVGKLEEIRAKAEKAIIFADIIEVQNSLIESLESTFRVRVDVINGETPSNSTNRGRDAVLSRFRRAPGFGVLILSPKAAGVGLTILEANHVIHFSRLWNPAREDQATDRVYRIGQTREVHVYYPLARHPAEASIDLYMNDVLEKKRQIAQSALFPAALGNIELEDIEGFFSNGYRSAVQELPGWLRLLRQTDRQLSVEDCLAALEPTGIRVHNFIPRVARVRSITASELSRHCGRVGCDEEMFFSPPPTDAEAAVTTNSKGEWVLFLRRSIEPIREVHYLKHAVMHRAMGHLERSEQPGHWERWQDVVSPSRRWDQEVSKWLPEVQVT